MKSYGLNQLDLKVLPYLKDCKNKFFVECGANDGVGQSNTKILEDNFGWIGLLIEPNFSKYLKCKDRRPKSIVENYALVSKDYELDTIKGYFHHEDFVKSMCAQVAVQNYLKEMWKNDEPVEVPAITFQSLIEKYKIDGNKIDFFSLDVEGYEFEVLQGMNFEKTRPEYFLIETWNKADIQDNVRNFMKNVDYEFVSRLSHNDDFFKRK
jgi:FkbM family methyltransferase